MGLPDNELVAKDSLTLDGVSYEIAVRKRSNGFHAAWKCAHCAAGGATIVEKAAESALDRARANVVAHHTLRHRPSP